MDWNRSSNPYSSARQLWTSSHDAPSSSAINPAHEISMSSIPDRQVAARTPAFQSLLELAEKTLSELKIQPSLKHKNLADVVYDNYAYFPHSRDDVSRIRSQHTSEQRERSFVALSQLADQYAGSVKLYLQPRNPKDECLAPFDAISRAHASPNPRAAMSYVLHDPYAMRRLNSPSQSLKGDDGIESRLSISVKPEYAGALAEVLVELCSSGIGGFAYGKIFGPAEHSVRSETGILYLSQTDPKQAALLSELVHNNLAYKVSKVVEQARSDLSKTMDHHLLENAPSDLSNGDFYAGSPPGTQAVRPGIAYSEKPPGSSRQISSGTEKTKVVAQAIADHRLHGKDLESALFDCLKQHGYSTDNPAFALRPNADITAQERVDILQSRAPENFKETFINLSVVTPKTARTGNGRRQFEYLLGRNIR